MSSLIISFGEVLWDLFPDGSVLGGAPANLAFRLNSLGESTRLISRVGNDELGRVATAQLKARGMDTQFLQQDPHLPTGSVQVHLDARGNPDFFIVPDVAYDRIELLPGLTETTAQARCFCFGTLVQRAPLSRSTLEALIQAAPQALKFLDLNLRKDCFTSETVSRSLELADVLKLNESEAQYLASQFGLPNTSLVHCAQETIRRWDLSEVVVTLGERGALAMHADGETVYSPGFQISIRDTCGSGDAFSAAFLSGRWQEKPLSERVCLGNALGALVSGQSGATEPVSLLEIRSFSESEAERVIDPAFKEWMVM